MMTCAPSCAVPVNYMAQMIDLDVKGPLSFAGAKMKNRMTMIVEAPSQEANPPIAMVVQGVTRCAPVVDFDDGRPA